MCSTNAQHHLASRPATCSEKKGKKMHGQKQNDSERQQRLHLTMLWTSDQQERLASISYHKIECIFVSARMQTHTHTHIHTHTRTRTHTHTQTSLTHSHTRLHIPQERSKKNGGLMSNLWSWWAPATSAAQPSAVCEEERECVCVKGREREKREREREKMYFV